MARKKVGAQCEAPVRIGDATVFCVLPKGHDESHRYEFSLTDYEVSRLDRLSEGKGRK